MKKLLIALMLVSCLISTAVAEDIKPGDIINSETHLSGIIDIIPEEFVANSLKKGDLTADGAVKAVGGVTWVQTLTEGLMLLNSGRVDALFSSDSTAKYVAARNSGLVPMRALYETSMCMLAAADRWELIETLNRGIESMKADGAITQLWDEHVLNVIDGGEPSPVALPDNPDGLKLRVGVSGDMPPMDYVSADGTPAGFNTALLAELAKRENLSIELVQIDAGARFAALASGRIDLFFWQTRVSLGLSAENYGGSLEEFKLAEDEIINCLTTAPYITEYGGWLFQKAYVEERLK